MLVLSRLGRPVLSRAAISTATSARTLATVSPTSRFFPTEPSSPSILTPIPGPLSTTASSDISTFQESRAHQLVVDYPSSLGTWIRDADGNTYLDVFAQIASIAVGYNQPDLIRLAKSDEFAWAAMNRPAIGNFPPVQWADWINTGIGAEWVKPKGLSNVFTAMCGSCANEGAFKAAFMAYQSRERGEGATFSDEEMASCMRNAAPGAPKLSVLSFTKGFHGRLFGSLSATRSKAIHKIDIPAFDWPAVEWPAVQYPLSSHARENAEAEAASLAAVEETIEAWKSKSPVAAIIVEPIQSEGGDNHASPDFFRKLRKIAKDKGVFFIVDEVQTGLGATGTLWAHEKWGLSAEDAPDFVTFSKKMQAAGYYHNLSTRPNETYRAFNTWLGDPIRALQAREILRVIQRDDLVSHTASVGSYLFSSLQNLASSLPGGEVKIQNLRGEGEGSFISWDAPDSASRDRLLRRMKELGVQMGGCGERAVRCRPMLVFEKHHVDLLVERLDKAMREI